MDSRLLRKLSLLGTLLTAGCMPEPVPVCVAPVQHTPAIVVRPEPVCVVTPVVPVLPPPRLHYPPHHPRLPHPGFPEPRFRPAPGPRNLPPPPRHHDGGRR